MPVCIILFILTIFAIVKLFHSNGKVSFWSIHSPFSDVSNLNSLTSANIVNLLLRLIFYSYINLRKPFLALIPVGSHWVNSGENNLLFLLFNQLSIHESCWPLNSQQSIWKRNGKGAWIQNLQWEPSFVIVWDMGKWKLVWNALERSESKRKASLAKGFLKLSNIQSWQMPLVELLPSVHFSILFPWLQPVHILGGEGGAMCIDAAGSFFPLLHC